MTTFTNSTTTCANSQVVVTNASGYVLSVASACVGGTQTTVSASDTATVGGRGAFYILFTRASDTSGGLRVFKTVLSY